MNRFNGKTPGTGARGGMRLSATTTAARGASLTHGKPTIAAGRGISNNRILSAGAPASRCISYPCQQYTLIRGKS